jgi:hypothetical protein
VCVLFSCWLSPTAPDPSGDRLAVLRRALRDNPHIQAVFWDWPSLYQLPRTDEQAAVFKRGLEMMGDL